MLVGFGFNEFNQLTDDADSDILKPVLIKADTSDVRSVHCSWDRLFLVTGKSNVKQDLVWRSGQLTEVVNRQDSRWFHRLM